MLGHSPLRYLIDKIKFPFPITLTGDSMKKLWAFALITTALGLMFSGCDGAKNPIENSSSPKHLAKNSEYFDIFNISGSVFTDANTSGQLDQNETGIANVTVTLRDSENAVVGTAVTNGSGFYVFEELPAGSYTVQVDETTV